jgi:hypothetical protein
VAKLLTGGGGETASIGTVDEATRLRCHLEDECRASWQWYFQETGRQVEDVVPGFTTRLIVMDE